MRIQTIVIRGKAGDIEILGTQYGALVMCRDEVLQEVERKEPAKSRRAKAWDVAKYVFGRDRKGNPNATNSMVEEVLTEIERVAGC